MNSDLSSYRTLVFDCDGVILDSNQAKTEAFYQAAFAYGETAAQALVDHHVANGGVSRYQKFAHFLERIVPDQPGPKLESLLKTYADNVRQGLLNCGVAHELKRLRERTAKARWLIVSGGDQNELRDVFLERGLAELFDGGIFGSPESKDQILAREIADGNIRLPGCFFGDSRYDLQAARQAGLDFVFVRRWSEWSDWQTQQNHFTGAVDSLADLLSAEIRDEAP